MAVRSLERLETCDLCGGNDFSRRAELEENVLFTGERFTLVTCRGCSLSFLNPRPARNDIGGYYPDSYPPHLDQGAQGPARWQRTLGDTDSTAMGRLHRWWLARREDVAWFRVPRPHGERRILDLGAGSGKLLDLVRPLGWRTYAVDASPAAVMRARGKGHHAALGSAEERHFLGETFDVVYMWHSLEHVHSPRLALANAFDSMRPGGHLMLCVPNFHSAQARLFGRYWCSADAPRHLFQFTRATVRRYLEEAGFINVDIRTRTGATSWVRGLRNAINGLFGVRWEREPAWLSQLFEPVVIGGSLVGFLGVGSELRVTAERPVSAQRHRAAAVALQL